MYYKKKFKHQEIKKPLQSKLIGPCINRYTINKSYAVYAVRTTDEYRQSRDWDPDFSLARCAVRKKAAIFTECLFGMGSVISHNFLN